MHSMQRSKKQRNTKRNKIIHVKLINSGVKISYLASKRQDVDWTADSAKSIDGFAYDAGFQ